MELAVESFKKGYEAMDAVREDMASKDILTNLYAGKDMAQVAANPMENVATLNQASALAAQRGFNSLAYGFQKQAGALSKNVQEEQLNDIKVKQARLGYADQFLSAATDEESLKNAFAPIKDESAQMQIQSVIRNPNIPFDQKKEILGTMTKTVSQRLAAERLAIDAEYKEELIRVRDEDNLRKTKNAANAQANRVDKNSPEEKSNKELASLDIAEAKDLSRAETNPYVTDKKAAKEAIRAEYEKKRQAVRERRGTGTAAKSAYNADQEAWISKAMQLNPEMSRSQIINEGKRLKKL